MKFSIGFFRIWLILSFLLSFALVPLYLMGSYPDTFSSLRQTLLAVGIDMIDYPPSRIGPMLQVIYSGCIVAFCYLAVVSWLRGLGLKFKRQQNKMQD
jgi:hypothetical protein